MITDKYPELESLEPDEQLELASELAKVALRSQSGPDPSSKAVQLMEKRLDYFLEHPETGVRWENLRSQKDA